MKSSIRSNIHNYLSPRNKESLKYLYKIYQLKFNVLWSINE